MPASTNQGINQMALKGSILKPMLAFTLLLAIGMAILAWFNFDVREVLNAAKSTNPIIFLLLMSLLPLVGFPIAVFYLYAGTVFPWLIAWPVCTLALAINISLSYWIGSRLLKKPIQLWLAQKEYKVPNLQELGYFKLTFLIRAVPGVPFPIQNYLLTVAGTPFVLYLVVSLAVQSVFAAGMTAIPRMIIEPDKMKIIIVAAIFVVLIIARITIKLRADRQK
jgi:uncharacterized membrane protein YdjX (TVP38/TMEM64 family)